LNQIDKFQRICINKDECGSTELAKKDGYQKWALDRTKLTCNDKCKKSNLVVIPNSPAIQYCADEEVTTTLSIQYDFKSQYMRINAELSEPINATKSGIKDSNFIIDHIWDMNTKSKIQFRAFEFRKKNDLATFSIYFKKWKELKAKEHKLKVVWKTGGVFLRDEETFGKVNNSVFVLKTRLCDEDATDKWWSVKEKKCVSECNNSAENTDKLFKGYHDLKGFMCLTKDQCLDNFMQLDTLGRLCSNCGFRNKKHAIHQSTFTCKHCLPDYWGRVK